MPKARIYNYANGITTRLEAYCIPAVADYASSIAATRARNLGNQVKATVVVFQTDPGRALITMAGGMSMAAWMPFHDNVENDIGDPFNDPMFVNILDQMIANPPRPGPSEQSPPPPPPKTAAERNKEAAAKAAAKKKAEKAKASSSKEVCGKYRSGVAGRPPAGKPCVECGYQKDEH